jgi:hypothetical protein
MLKILLPVATELEFYNSLDMVPIPYLLPPPPPGKEEEDKEGNKYCDENAKAEASLCPHMQQQHQQESSSGRCPFSSSATTSDKNNMGGGISPPPVASIGEGEEGETGGSMHDQVSEFNYNGKVLICLFNSK